MKVRSYRTHERRAKKRWCCSLSQVSYTAPMPFGMGFGELVLILVIVLVVFGATKLPQLGDGLGRAIKNFKRSVGAIDEIDVTPRPSDKSADKSAGPPAPGPKAADAPSK